MIAEQDYVAELVLNNIMAIKRGVGYQQLLDNGCSPEFIKICKRIILYVEACNKNQEEIK
jgi:hypothetical protein